ncbi:hypothetical protein PVK06_020803 [Gossypium arboreum]|uniref:Uncharacterized protein n=1 Tax=Gossypium arboreum TaxID=29729 RepID=A0ABR0PNB4_GOSAR|nr:hypothetical protein PVK06_020803 [Gossypium arboreum]
MEAAAAPVAEMEVRVSLLTMSSDNLELGIEALTRLVREVLEGVKEIGETLRARCVDCKKKRDHSSLRLKPGSMKHVKTRLGGCYGGYQGGIRGEICGDFQGIGNLGSSHWLGDLYVHLAKGVFGCAFLAISE